MDALVGTFHVLAGVILVGGVAKLSAPDAFATLLRTTPLPAARPLARLIGLAEIALGAAAVLVGGRLIAAVVAVAYGAFTAVVVAARRAGAPTCGCFGATAAPPHGLHVTVNAVSGALAAATAAAGDVPGMSAVLREQPVAGIPYLVAVGTAIWLVVALSTSGSALASVTGSVAALGPTYRRSRP